jgi:hypothetical protein
LRLAELGFEDAGIDLGAHVIDIARVHARGGALQVTRDRAGRINVVDMLPGAGAPVAAAEPGAPWTATVRRVELGGFSADVHDEASGTKLRVADATAMLEGAGTDLDAHAPVPGRLADGRRRPARRAGTGGAGHRRAAGDLRVAQFSLVPFEPMLRQACC